MEDMKVGMWTAYKANGGEKPVRVFMAKKFMFEPDIAQEYGPMKSNKADRKTAKKDLKYMFGHSCTFNGIDACKAMNRRVSRALQAKKIRDERIQFGKDLKQIEKEYDELVEEVEELK